MALLDQSFLQRPAPEVARALIGVVLLLDGVGGKIVETEAYDRADPASHSFAGRTARNASMFGPAGHAYVYRSYGVHWCLNVVCGSEPSGGAVLLRALEPQQGIDVMRERRGTDVLRDLCRGPGRLCRALAVTGAHDGHSLRVAPFALMDGQGVPEIAAGPRIGITRGTETPWRFGEVGSRFLSRPLGG